MLISDSHKLILMLPQKCATSTLQNRLRTIHDLEEFGRSPRYHKKLDRLLTKHVGLKTALLLEEFQSRAHYTKACFVRNPYDRIYSWYLWTIRHNRDQLHKLSTEPPSDTVDPTTGLSDAMRLEQALYVKRQLEKADYDFNRFIRNKPKMFNCISDFTHQKGISHIDFIGRVESFEKDFDRLCAKINFKPEHRWNLNQSDQRKSLSDESFSYPQYIHHYDAKTVYRINRAHTKDFENFGYRTISPLAHLFRAPN